MGAAEEVVRPSRFELLTFCFGGKLLVSIPFVSSRSTPAEAAQNGVSGANCGGICGGRLPSPLLTKGSEVQILFGEPNEFRFEDSLCSLGLHTSGICC
jgi:hypothetical protein